jgi:hypothetical protein
VVENRGRHGERECRGLIKKEVALHFNFFIENETKNESFCV